jgi:hypothetical protein
MGIRCTDRRRAKKSSVCDPGAQVILVLRAEAAYSLVSAGLAEALRSSGLGKFAVADAEVTLSPEAQEMLAGRVMPRFHWWKVAGRAGVDHFGLTEKAQLVVSNRGLDVLRTGRLNNCDIGDYHRPS